VVEAQAYHVEEKVNILEVERLSKAFGGVNAIFDLDLDVKEREILGLIGPNGSGKTTFFNLVSGLLKPDRGEIRFQNKKITGLKPHKICLAGIARTFQIVKPFFRMSPLENIMVGRAYGGAKPARNREEARREAEEILAFTGLAGKRVPRAGMLNLIDRKRLEIARALGTRPKLLLLDEVMAGLNTAEIEEAMRFVKEMRDTGITIIMVEHVMKAVLGISDRVVVLNVGEKIAEGTPDEIANNQKVIDAYLGAEEYA
jgi:branched-chain amino acid transport system ATP-binding protein